LGVHQSTEEVLAAANLSRFGALAAIIVLAEGSALAPFIYSLF